MSNLPANGARPDERAATLDRLRGNFDLADEELAAAVPMAERHNARPRRPRFKVESRDGKTNLAPAGASGDQQSLEQTRLFDALATRSEEFADVAIKYIASLLQKDGQLEELELNAALAVIAAVEPRNEAEALLAVQMFASHRSALQALGWMRAAAEIEHTVRLGGLANKFLRTYTMQIEALAKLRRGGEQVVRHVHVNEGGQAVIAGTINQGGGGKSKNG